MNTVHTLGLLAVVTIVTVISPWSEVHSQINPVCVMCGGVPGIPNCTGGRPSGADVCSISGGVCTQTGICGGGGGGCFVAGTLVETIAGPVAIEDLSVGDQVLGSSGDGAAVFNEVLDTYRTLAVEYFIINGELSVTGTHPFMVHGNWTKARDLRVGDTLVGEDGIAVRVNAVEPVDYGVRVYNITVAGNHTFFADGILAHNKGPNPEG